MQESIRPTLTDLIGSAWFLSTPKGQNYFKTLFDRGQDPEREDWASWQMPTSANPYIDPLEIDAARQDLTEAAFNQEYLALFVNWEGSVFRHVCEAATAAPRTQPEAGHEYVFGVDWGRSNDYTVFVVVDTTSHTMVALDRSKRVDYTVQRDRLRALYDVWRPKQILTEQNSIGQPIIEQLMRDRLPIQPFITTNASKAQAIEALALAFERGDIQILNDAVLVSELVAYQVERLSSGLPRYGAPSGQHDDCVMALAIAWSAVSAPRQLIYPIAESELIVEPFKIPFWWWRGYGLDVGPGGTAAIWAAVDPGSEVLYLYDEYYGVNREPLSVHATAIQRRGHWIPGIMEVEAHGRTRRDGFALHELYRKLGLKLETTENLVESGIEQVWQRMNVGGLKVFASLEHYLDELRNYHRDERGQIVTGRDHLQNATRCLLSRGMRWMWTGGTSRTRSYPTVDFPPNPQGWMRL